MVETSGLRSYFKQRVDLLSGLMEDDEATLEAARMTVTFAQNSGYSWEYLQRVFENHPDVLAKLSGLQGKVDNNPLGLARCVVVGREVRRQGVFSEVKK